MDVIQNKGSKEDPLLCCRACLSTEGRLFDIHDYKLGNAFALITGSPVCKDKLPQRLCAYCGVQLLKSASFRDMCLRSQQTLTSELLKDRPDSDGVRRINRPCNQFLELTLTEVHTIECIQVLPADDIKQEPNTNDIDVFKESNATRARKSETKVKLETDIEEDTNLFIEEVKIEPEVEFEKSNVTVRSISGVRLVKLPLKRQRTKKEGIKKRKTVSVKTVSKTKSRAPRRKAAANDEREKRKIRSAENDYMPEFDVAKFESTYGVKIMILNKDAAIHETEMAISPPLSQEQQLEDLATRKQTDNYRQSRFRCEACFKGFHAEAAYTNHKQRHDPSEGDFVCEICSVRYKRRFQVQKHQDVHRLKLVCEVCGFVSRSRCQAKVHHAIHEGKTYQCQYCGKTIDKKSTYFSHMRVVHPALLSSCEECGETFVGDNGLRMHKLRAHAGKPQQFRCTTCSVKFVSLEALNRHTDTAGEHADLRPCEQCGENCASETALQEHVIEKHPKETHRCEECDMTFSSGDALNVHHQRKHLNQRPPFMAAADLALYKRGISARRRAALRACPAQPSKPYMCEQCGQVLRNSTLLRYHQRLHEEGNPFKCSMCPKTFSIKCNMQTHMRTHTGERPFQCADCPLAFAEKRNLLRHHRTTYMRAHRGETVQCADCRLAFAEKRNLLRHHRTAHQGIRERIPCSICGRELSTKSALKLHVATVHDGQPWPRRDRTKRPKLDKHTTLLSQ